MAKRVVNIREQVIEDTASGLTIEFKQREDGEARMVLRSSTLPFGNREIQFDKDGQYVGAGTWLR
jgi:hypothetical protein